MGLKVLNFKFHAKEIETALLDVEWRLLEYVKTVMIRFQHWNIISEYA